MLIASSSLSGRLLAAAGPSLGTIIPAGTVALARLAACARGARSFSSQQPHASNEQRAIQLLNALDQVQSPAPEPTATRLFIDGESVDALDGRTYLDIDPRSGLPICKVAEAGPADIDRAVLAARRAFDAGPWPRIGGRERGRVLNRLANLIEEHADELAALETLDVGKPLSRARAHDVPLAVDQLRYMAGWADKLGGSTLPVDGDYFAYTLREPIGVVGSITPWNFPLLMATWKFAPALAAGNTAILKISETTPLSMLRVAELALEAGVPPGVLNVVAGPGKTAGGALAAHALVDRLSFMGTTSVGARVTAASALNVTRVSLELGGKSAAIVCADADLEQAVEETHLACFYNMGEFCAAGSRTFVHESLYDEFVERAAARTAAVRVGDPFDARTEMGPLASEAQLKNVLKYVDAGVAGGALLVEGGERVGSTGYYMRPAVFAGVKDEMAIAQEEIFGPVMSILKFSSDEEVVQRANASKYGLAAGVWTRSHARANTLARALRAGTIWVNCYAHFDAALPFGGFKHSGHGRDKGLAALEQVTELKVVETPLEAPTWN